MIIEQFVRTPPELTALIQEDPCVTLVACSEVYNLEGCVKDCFTDYSWTLTDREPAYEALRRGLPVIYSEPVKVYALGSRINNS